VGPVMLAAGATAAAAFLIARALAPAVHALLQRGGMVRRNYRGEEVAVGIGIVVPLAALAPWTGLLVAGFPVEAVAAAVSLATGMALLGFFDDALGDRTASGFRGHLGALLAGRPTTGSLKAVFGGLLALFGGLALHGLSWKALLAAALIAGAANGVNLLDVRPGRALKAFVFLWIIAGLAAGISGGPAAVRVLAAAAAPLGGALALWRGDHKGRWMLGDAGANALGASAGLALALSPLPWQIPLLAALTALHLYSERASLSKLIDAVPLLSRLDRWGR